MNSLYLSAVNHNLEISNQVCKIFIVKHFNDNLKIYLLLKNGQNNILSEIELFFNIFPKRLWLNGPDVY